MEHIHCCPFPEVIGVSNASVLLLHPPSNSLYLGARDSILVLDPSNLTHKGPVVRHPGCGCGCGCGCK